jgi:hypothetical protein
MTGEMSTQLEPQAIDEERSLALQVLSSEAGLRNTDRMVDECCENCQFYLENTANISYCWHPKLRILVGSDWSCAWWEPLPENG